MAQERALQGAVLGRSTEQQAAAAAAQQQLQVRIQGLRPLYIALFKLGWIYERELPYQ